MRLFRPFKAQNRGFLGLLRLKIGGLALSKQYLFRLIWKIRPTGLLGGGGLKKKRAPETFFAKNTLESPLKTDFGPPKSAKICHFLPKIGLGIEGFGKWRQKMLIFCSFLDPPRPPVFEPF